MVTQQILEMKQKMREFLLFRAIDQFPGSRFDPKVWDEQMKLAGLDQSNPWLYNFVLDGVTDGFSLQVEPDCRLDSTHRNLPTNAMGDLKITRWLLDSLNKGWVMGPFKPDQIPRDVFPHGVHVNPIGAVPKPNGKIRPIVNCSAPRSGNSVNSSMSEEWKTVKYTSFLDIVRLVRSVGRDGYLWSADAADAYLQLSIKRGDCKYIAVNWLGLILVFCVLIFGLSSAPRIYTHFADVIEEIVKSKEKQLWSADNGIQLIRHYLDDFFGGHSSFESASKQFRLFLDVLSTLNVPFAPHKVVPPARSQKLLWFIWDTSSMTVSIPPAKFKAVKEQLLKLRRLKK